MAKKETVNKGLPKITKDLQELVRTNKLIEKVYFDSEGNHYFNTHTTVIYDLDKHGVSKSAKTMTVLPGVKWEVGKIVNGNGSVSTKRVNTTYKEVAKEMTREEILEAEAIELSMTEKEEAAIIAKATDILNRKGVKESLIKS